MYNFEQSNVNDLMIKKNILCKDVPCIFDVAINYKLQPTTRPAFAFHSIAIDAFVRKCKYFV